MNKSFGQNLKKFAKENAPGLCVAIGLGSLVFATVMAIYETPKAVKAIEEMDDISEEEDTEEIEETTEEEEETEKKKLTFDRAKNIVKTTWKFYIPTTVATAVGIFLVLKSHSMMKNRLAAITVAYTGIDTAYKLYKKNAADILGEKKEQEISDAVAKDRIKDKEPVEDDIIVVKPGTLCYDVASDRYFRSDIESVKRAINEMNRYLLDECYVSLNEVYYEMGLKGVKTGDSFGWRIDNGLIDVSFSSQIAPNGEPCLVIDFYAEPTYNNQSLF